jgi:hypothetical protein
MCFITTSYRENLSKKNIIMFNNQPDKKFIFKDKDFLLTKSCEMDKFVKTELLFSNVFVHSAAEKWSVMRRVMN